MKKYLLIALLGIFLLFLGMFLSKSEIELRLRPQYIVVIKNPYFSSFINRSAYLYINKNGKYLSLGKILHGPFDRPLYFTLNKEKGEIYCLYSYDICAELLVFSIYHKDDNNIPAKLDMIRSSNYFVRVGKKDEINFLKEDINKSTTDDFLFKSVPIIEIVFLKKFLSKKQMLDILDSVPNN